MIRLILALLAGLLLGVAVTDTAYADPGSATCYEDEPCWRVWMGEGEIDLDSPLFMYMPEGPQWDALAPFLGYSFENSEDSSVCYYDGKTWRSAYTLTYDQDCRF